jgi:hypothetical protein
VLEIPKTVIIHVSGIPASGKSTFCRYLAREHEFAHYELECFPRGWPHPELHAIWERDRAAFVNELRRQHDLVAIEWGFPPRFRPLVDELSAAGARLVWFQADIVRAREVFVTRGGMDVGLFDEQVRQIQDARLPAGLGARVIESLDPTGAFKAAHAIAEEVFN